MPDPFGTSPPRQQPTPRVDEPPPEGVWHLLVRAETLIEAAASIAEEATPDPDPKQVPIAGSRAVTGGRTAVTNLDGQEC